MSLDLLELNAENQRLNTEGQTFLDHFVRMPEGNGAVVLRLLPPATAGMFERKKSPFFQATRTHRLNNRSYHCPKVLNGTKWVGKCPICEYYNWLWKESDTKPADEAKSLQTQARNIKPVERYYYNVIVRQVVNPSTQEVQKNVGPKILSIGKTLHKSIIEAIVGREDIGEPPLGDVTDLLKGRDFKIIKSMRQSGKDAYPTYDNSKFLEPSPLGEPDDVKRWLENVHDLVALRVVLDAEELKKQLKIHLGLIPDQTTAFNPAEYQAGGGDDEPIVVTTIEAKKPSPAAILEGGDISEDINNVDEDFLSDLKNIA